MNTAEPAVLDSPASWRVLAGAGLVFAFGVQALFGSTFGLFMVPLQQSFGWGRAEIALSLTLTTAIAWLSVLAGGWLADHARLRPLLVSGVVLGAANLAAFGLMTQLWHFYVLVAALAFTSMGASPLILAKLVQSWFDKRLGSALGILFSCAAVGAVLHPIITIAVMTRAGWRPAFFVMGAIALVGGLLAVGLAIRERPGAGVPARDAAATSESSKPPLIAFLGNATWWRLAAWNLLFGFGAAAITVHFAALLHDRGLGPVEIGLAITVSGVSHFAGNLLAGWLVDRIPPQRMAWLLMLLPLGATLLMLAGGSFAVLLLAAAVLGLTSGSDGCLAAFLARFYFSPQVYGQASGTQMIATAFGSGLAPWLSGLMRDRTGDYQLSLTCAAAAFALAVVAGWLLPRQGHAPAPQHEPAPQPVHA